METTAGCRIFGIDLSKNSEREPVRLVTAPVTVSPVVHVVSEADKKLNSLISNNERVKVQGVTDLSQKETPARIAVQVPIELERRSECMEWLLAELWTSLL
ncbi:unnamed protein product [Rhodiola kirilowii]